MSIIPIKAGPKSFKLSKRRFKQRTAALHRLSILTIVNNRYIFALNSNNAHELIIALMTCLRNGFCAPKSFFFVSFFVFFLHLVIYGLAARCFIMRVFFCKSVDNECFISHKNLMVKSITSRFFFENE